MNYQNIKVFQAILEHQNISAAAKSLNYTRSTVSEALKQLEDELGVQLIVRERGVRKVTLTPAGKRFVPLVEEWAEMDQHIQEFARTSKQRALRLAAGTRAHENIVPSIVHGLKKQCPELHVQLVFIPDGSVVNESIKAHQFDMAIYYGGNLENPLVMKYALFDEERSILCPANTVLPDRLLTPEDLDVAFEVVYSKTAFVSEASQKWRRSHFAAGKRWMSVPEWSAIDNYLTDPRCWALMPSGIALQMLARKPEALAIRQLAPAPPPLPCSLLVSRTYTDSEILQCVLQCCAEYADERPYLKRTLML